jgi:uncharacterized protein YecT (DUF1311 family)
MSFMALGLVAAGSAAQADPLYDQYMTSIESCFYDAADRDAASACIGTGADICMTTEDGGQSTVGMMSCMLAERDAWDKLLNAEYRSALAFATAMDDDERAHFPEFAVRKEQVRDAQRAWIGFRDANCAMSYGLWGSGSMRQIAGADCLLQMTATRTLDLHVYRSGMEGEW